MSYCMRLTLLTVVLLCGSVMLRAINAAETFTDPAKAGRDFAVQGEYVGKLKDKTWGVQVIALGKGKFDAVLYPGGLPGAGWDTQSKSRASGAIDEGLVVLKGDQYILTISKGALLQVANSGGETLGACEQVHRVSPTLGAKPPQGAVVLFDGSGTDALAKGTMDESKLLKEGVRGKQDFGSFTCHLEFRTPFMPSSRGQGRGNSGYYVQGKYEVQILDSFGLEGKDNECGGIYKNARPLVNMCFPPLSWQTYDVDFTAAQFENGKKVKNARITVKHNGVVIHDDLELKGPTPGGTSRDESKPGPLFLQNHGNPVRFQNIWVLEK